MLTNGADRRIAHRRIRLQGSEEVHACLIRKTSQGTRVGGKYEWINALRAASDASTRSVTNWQKPHLLRCQGCDKAFQLDKCPNCGSDSLLACAFWRGHNHPENNAGLMCECLTSYNRWVCDCCHHANDMTDSLELLQKKGGCFIATAAFGTQLAPEIVVLTTFRDQVLASTGAGRRFIEVYYRLSPPVAERIAGSAVLRRFVQCAILRPVLPVVRIILSRRAKQKGLKRVSRGDQRRNATIETKR